jgi:hypothetical protein
MVLKELWVILLKLILEYKTGKSNIKVGRQGIDSIMLATNDTKMIPNTFEAAVVIENKDIPDTIEFVQLTSCLKKLRDHQSFHSVIALQWIGKYSLKMMTREYIKDSTRTLASKLVNW